jgi:hypothetical protein
VTDPCVLGIMHDGSSDDTERMRHAC